MALCNVLPSYCPSSTPDNSISRVFISYAHKDGAKLAAQLKEDFLLETGFDTWLDNTKRLTGSDLWPNAIEKAIDDADIVIALLSHASDCVRSLPREQLRPLRKGKCLIPPKVGADCDLPIYLEARQWLDCSRSKTNNNNRLKLMEAIEVVGSGDGRELRIVERHSGSVNSVVFSGQMLRFRKQHRVNRWLGRGADLLSHP
jgi:hypothetical protein